MRYEEMKKEDLVKLCKEYEMKLNSIREDNFVLEEHKIINENILNENVHLREDNESLRATQIIHLNTMDNLREQIRVYENCLNAMSRIRGE